MKYLKEFRQQTRLSQRQVAEMLEISYGYYKQIENDFRRPSFEILVKLKKTFNQIDMNKIFNKES